MGCLFWNWCRFGDYKRRKLCWRKNCRYDFYIAIGLSFILYLLIKFCTYDSPRQYIDNKDEKNVKIILQGIARFNGIEKEFLEKYESEEYQKLIREIMEYDYDENNTKNENEIEMKDIDNKKINDQLINSVEKTKPPEQPKNKNQGKKGNKGNKGQQGNQGKSSKKKKK